ncbi:MAG: nickel pincer cofactor biosynthesis protein LarC [Gemmatimonadales bacterium]|nr:nickel pincer cofactor biosynthesis protein LarC [Gemmatimonadales bacterium]MBP9199247.1 nickel pincer cofactor biosynthesis protein LarC [Gemmatimonadales bacterium]
MTAPRCAILDPAAGISGDMLLGALLDAGAPATWLAGLPARLGFPEVGIEVGRTLRCGIACTKVTVRLPDGASEEPSPAYGEPGAAHAHAGAGEPHHHAHHGHGKHRHLADLLAVVERAPLSEWVRVRAVRAFTLLCEEEGRVHDVPASEVALHEVGAVDALVDIVGGIEGFEQLGITEVYHRPVAVGAGWVRAAHGVMPVPAPVTARLLEGITIAPNGPVVGEATTPTGAVLLRVLGSGPIPSRWQASGTGWGAGGRNPEEYPNALRLTIAEAAEVSAEVVTLSADVDDLSPEYVEPLREALASAGALDAQVWGTLMKKGRPGYRIEVICDTDRVAAVTEAFFLHSTTAGLRRTHAERVTLPRRMIAVPLAGAGPVAVKVLETPAGPRVKAEFEDVRRAARELGRPALEVAREVETAARALVTPSPRGRA